MIPTCLAFLSFLSTAIVAPPDFRAYAGNYHVGPNEVIAIAEWELDPGSPHVLAFTNLKTGRIGVLSELAADEFALREGLLAGPQVASIHFIRSRDSVIALIYAPASGPSLRAQRVATRREDLSFNASGAPQCSEILILLTSDLSPSCKALRAGS